QLLTRQAVAVAVPDHEGLSARTRHRTPRSRQHAEMAQPAPGATLHRQERRAEIVALILGACRDPLCEELRAGVPAIGVLARRLRWLGNAGAEEGAEGRAGR